ncbi:TerB family tellurite resistance protein [Pseudooceanicola sp.]|uniref:tellurite resistance TerB family protein n=1 Tax=Pseudooceanicola sp. TaxID=1914328 RepID=UPI002605C1F5|nr:TerB family tellurite resistance protein [Pseudooceanicola sp.]MDF1853966.1 TerB family tellurite resistance protein [Pseudooceanicola sp.]
MSIWTRITEAIAALAKGEGLTAVFDKLRGPREKGVAFAIAVIALGAKMAKADGVVSRVEVRAFREVFRIAPEDEASAARVFNLARQDSAGFEAYAKRIAGMFRDDPGVLCNLLEGLFYIAMADGGYHPEEDAYLKQVAEIFGLDERAFSRLRARFVPEAEHDPYDVLDVAHDAPMPVVRAAWRAAVRASHPDQLQAQGLPKESIRMAEKRMVDINRAWAEIREERGAAA